MPTRKPVSPPARPPRVACVSLGCAKNTVDSETVLGELLGGGWELALDPSEADLAVVNTCGFIADARQESHDVIAELLALSAEEPGPKVAVMGCLARLAEGPRLLITEPSYAYLRLADGCNNCCAYCNIPNIRGRLRSRPADAIVREAQTLIESGVKELILVSQDTTAYGLDAGSTMQLQSLLQRLLQETSAPRIRLMYAHPRRVGPELLALLAAEKRLCHYLDLPIQHINDAILRQMNRGYGEDQVRALLAEFKRYPQLVLRSSLITGFPGEGEAEFAQLLQLVESGVFQHLGVFAYSREENTPAYNLPRQVDPELARQRRDLLMAAQQKITFAWLDSRRGNTEEVLIDAQLKKNLWRGRTLTEAPEIDGQVMLKGKKFNVGGIIRACLKKRDEYDMVAEAVN